MSVLSVAPLDADDNELPQTPVFRLVPAHEHAWALRDVEYDNGFSLNRFECDSCLAVRFT